MEQFFQLIDKHPVEVMLTMINVLIAAVITLKAAINTRKLNKERDQYRKQSIHYFKNYRNGRTQ